MEDTALPLASEEKRMWCLYHCVVTVFSSLYVRDLNEEVQNLERAKQRLQHSIEDAGRYGKPIEADVEQWMKYAETAADQARRTLAHDGADNKTCFWGWLPNPKVHYRLGRDARTTVKVIQALILQSPFDRVYFGNYPPRLVGGATDLNSLAGHGGDTMTDSFCSRAPGDCENREKRDAGGGIRKLRPPVLSPRPFVDNVSSTRDFFDLSDTRKGPRGDKDYPVQTSDKREWSDGDDEKVDKESTSQRKDDPGSCLSRSVEDEESDDEYEVGNSLSANKLEPVQNVSPHGSWKKGQILGSGSSGYVYKGFTDDGFCFAAKEFYLSDPGTQGMKRVLQLGKEIAFLSRFEHKNIVQYLGTAKDKKYFYIFLELMTEGSLETLYNKNDWRDSNVPAYTREILDGLKYLHGQTVVHRDIKCANILVDASGSVKLADFGLAKATEISDAKSSRGTAFWMAPEVANLQNGSYGPAADIWSLGCTVLEMLTRQRPYPDLEYQALFKLWKGEGPPVPDDISGDARDFILKCLQVDPVKRPSAAELLDHAFVRNPPTSSCASASPRFNNAGP